MAAGEMRDAILQAYPYIEIRRHRRSLRYAAFLAEDEKVELCLHPTAKSRFADRYAAVAGYRDDLAIKVTTQYMPSTLDFSCLRQSQIVSGQRALTVPPIATRSAVPLAEQSQA